MTPTAVLLTVLGYIAMLSSLRESPEGGCRTRAFLPVLMFNYAGEPWKTQRAVRRRYGNGISESTLAGDFPA